MMLKSGASTWATSRGFRLWSHVTSSEDSLPTYLSEKSYCKDKGIIEDPMNFGTYYN